MSLKKKLAAFLSAAITMTSLSVGGVSAEETIRNLKGDINGDGDVTVADIVALSHCIIGKAVLESEDILYADMNDDGNVNVLDVVLLKRTVLGLIDRVYIPTGLPEPPTDPTEMPTEPPVEPTESPTEPTDPTEIPTESPDPTDPPLQTSTSITIPDYPDPEPFETKVYDLEVNPNSTLYVEFKGEGRVIRGTISYTPFGNDQFIETEWEDLLDNGYLKKEFEVPNTNSIRLTITWSGSLTMSVITRDAEMTNYYCTSDIEDMPSEYQSALDWVWENRIAYEHSTERWNTIFDQIYGGNGTLNYVVRWQSYKTLTLEQRQKMEDMIETSVNEWTQYLVGYDDWKYEHIDVNIVGWAVIDESVILDKQPDEIIYTNCTPYNSKDDATNGREEIPNLLPNAPDELSRMYHFDNNIGFDYPGGLDKRFDMYLWGTQGFPDIGGCGGDWGQRLSDDAYINMLDGTNIHVFEHELGHGFGITDFYGEEGTHSGRPVGGFPEPTIMWAGDSQEITNYDGWQLRYIWSKIKDQTNENNVRRFK